MADEASETPERELHTFPEEHDWFLALLVGLTNRGSEMGITLLVGGFLVSGTMVGGAAYFEGFASEFSSVFPKDSAEGIREAFATGAEPYKKASASGETLEQESYIHLKEARFFNTSGTPIPGNRGVWWRGRLSQVSGFNLGSLGA